MVWSSWSSSILIASTLLFATSNGDFPSGAILSVRCMLAQSVPKDCAKLPEVAIPSYLVQAYDNSSSSIHEALRSGQLHRLSNAQLANLPLSLLYLIPRGRLTDLNGTQLGAIVWAHADDTSLATQVAVSLQHGRHMLQLIHKLKMSPLSKDVARALGEAINPSDLTEPFLKSLPHFKHVILAYLRPNLLLKLDASTVFKVLYHLVDLEMSDLPRKQTLHVLSQAAIRHNYSLSKNSWLLLGLTPDEIKNDSLHLNIDRNNFKLDLSSMQARALFKRAYYNRSLSQEDFIDCQPLLAKLTPELLQRFTVTEHNYQSLVKLPSPLSLSTASQIREYVKADCKLTGKLPRDEDEKWGPRIKHLGPWVYTLPLASLEEYLESPLTIAPLLEIDSPAISPIQAYYVTGRGTLLDVSAMNTILSLHTLLHALPASQLVNRKVGETNSAVLQHLVAKLPADNLPRTLSLVHKIASSIDEEKILEHLLDNSDVNVIMSLVSPKDLQAFGPRMLKIFETNKDYWSTVQQLPRPVLAALLEQAQQRTGWSWNSLLNKSKVSHLLVGGITCKHIQDMDTGLFIPIIAQYNRQRKEGFPKNLQLCSLRKLISHLQLKMTLTQTDPRVGLISLLEPVEIESVGGYVLVGLPVEAMKDSPYLGHILSAIGKLSNAELMTAANMTEMKAIAHLAIDKEGNVDVFIAGNLVWFLPPNILIPELRLGLESGLLDTALCLPAASRRYLAVNLVAEFGTPEGWSAGVLTTLQDLLLVFTDEELRNVSKSSWTEAADCFTSHYTDEVHLVTPEPFYQVCYKILGKSEEVEYKSAVSSLVRWHLRAAQWQLDTVQQLSHGNSIKPSPIYPALNVKYQPEYTIHYLQPEPEEKSISNIESSTDSTTSSTDGSTSEASSSSSTETITLSTTEEITSTSTESIMSTETSTISPTEKITMSTTAATEKITLRATSTTEKNTKSTTSPTVKVTMITTSPTEKITMSTTSTTEKIIMSTSSIAEKASSSVKSGSYTDIKMPTENNTPEDTSSTLENDSNSEVKLHSENDIISTTEVSTSTFKSDSIKDKTSTGTSTISTTEEASSSLKINSYTEVKPSPIYPSLNHPEYTIHYPQPEEEEESISNIESSTDYTKSSTDGSTGTSEDSTTESTENNTVETTETLEKDSNSESETRSEDDIIPTTQVSTSTFKTDSNIKDEISKENNTDFKTHESFVIPDSVSNTKANATKESLHNSNEDLVSVNTTLDHKENTLPSKDESSMSTNELGTETSKTPQTNSSNETISATTSIKHSTIRPSTKGNISPSSTLNDTSSPSNDNHWTTTTVLSTSVFDQGITDAPLMDEEDLANGTGDFDTKEKDSANSTQNTDAETFIEPDMKNIGVKEEVKLANSTASPVLYNVQNSTESSNTATISQITILNEATSVPELNSTHESKSDVHYEDEEEAGSSLLEDGDIVSNDETEYYTSTQHSLSEDMTNNINHREKRNAGSDYNVQLTCNALRMVGKSAALALSKSDLAEMSKEELDECRVELGAMNLSLHLQEQIWKRINSKDGLHLLGSLLRVAAIGDLWDHNFDVSQPWALETIHALKKNINKTVVLEYVLKQVHKSNSDFPPELLTVLGTSICDLEPENLRTLVVLGLEPWTSCPLCLPMLGQKAVTQLGPVSEWTQHHVHALHGIVAGLALEDWKLLVASPYTPLTALQPSVIRCLNTSHLEILTPDQIGLIPTLTLQALSEAQTAVLSPDQLAAVANATQLTVPEKLTSTKVILVGGIPSAGTYNVESSRVLLYFLVFVSVLQVLSFV